MSTAPVRVLLAMVMAALLPGATAADIIADFTTATVVPEVFAGAKRGASTALETVPGSTGKGLVLRWQEQHSAFQEVYLPSAVQLSAQGTIAVRLKTVGAHHPASLSLRIRDGKGEMFDFAAPVEKLAADAWNTVTIALREGAQKGHWGGNPGTGHLAGALWLAGFATYIGDGGGSGELWLADIALTPASDGGTRGGTPRVVPRQWDITGAHLLAPFWKDRTVRGESLLFIAPDATHPATAELLFAPTAIHEVRSAAGDRVYHEGTDYTLSGRTLTLTPGSAIPALVRADLYSPKGAPRAIKAKVGDLETWLLYEERFFPTVQVEVDYERAEEWIGYHPEFAGRGPLKHTVAKLAQRAALRIAVVGDSITAGANASAGSAPYMPAYIELVAEILRRTSGSAVEVKNLAAPGTMIDGALEKLPAVCAWQPDLVIIAYGANDVARRDPKAYGAALTAIMQQVRKQVPQAEFIIVTCSLLNPEWTWPPAEEFPKYRTAALAAAGSDAAVADLTALYSGILARQSYCNLTGNGVNHPNDHGHRLYAEVLLGLLLE